MAALSEQPETSQNGLEVEDVTALHDKLDALWEKYLNHLDEYQRAQNALRKQLSSGFFSLAQANYKSLNRNRYGQDFYDQRMEATRRCCVQTSADAPPCVVPVPYRSSQAAGTEDQKQLVANDGNASKSDSVSQQPSPPATPPAKGEERDLTELAESGISKRDDSTPVEKNDASTRAEQAVKPRDPVQWFGILVPRELRSAQASFVSAVDDPSFIAVNAARGMREVEVEIRKVRKAVRKAERVHSG